MRGFRESNVRRKVEETKRGGGRKCGELADWDCATDVGGRENHGKLACLLEKMGTKKRSYASTIIGGEVQTVVPPKRRPVRSLASQSHPQHQTSYRFTPQPLCTGHSMRFVDFGRFDGREKPSENAGKGHSCGPGTWRSGSGGTTQWCIILWMNRLSVADPYLMTLTSFDVHGQDA